MDGLIVSNHGSRQLDGAIGSFDALPRIIEEVDGKIPALFDNGIRGGSDIFKAIALGAAAVCVGRPYVYGLAVAGQRGIYEVFRNLIAEFDITLGLSGHARVADLSPDLLTKQPSP